MESYPIVIGICRNIYITAGDPPLCNKEDFDKELERLKKQLKEFKKIEKRQEKYAKKHHQ